jgi:hypothetical protein
MLAPSSCPFGECWRAAVICCALSLTAVSITSAQDEISLVGHALKATVLDATTYPAAVLHYDSTMRDWTSSQPLLRHGFVEQNPRFTLSGLSNDRPVSYGAGKNQILRDAFSVLAVTAAHNFGTRLIEDAMKARYPEHRKMVAVIGWIERIGLSSYISFRVSAAHYRQWKRNERLAAQLGIR